MVATAARVLFLDDDPARGEAFLAAHPDAVWVRTAAECLARLEDPAGWSEVHLDHDLGGACFVDPDRPDTGMEVVRRLCDRPRDALRGALFVVHSHNRHAACVMLFHLQGAGYRAVARPFAPPSPAATARPWRRLLARPWGVRGRTA